MTGKRLSDGLSLLGTWVLYSLYFMPSLLAFWAGVRFLRVWKPSRVGHLAIEVDCYIKEVELGRRPRHRAVLIIKRNASANPRLLDYWADHISVISHPIARFFLKPLQGFTYLAIPLWIDGENTSYSKICAAWEGRAPVLKLREDDRERGADALAILGIPSGAWFACFHSRESGYAPGDAEAHEYRDSEISSYQLAMREVVMRGGWCVRMGDASMKPLEPMEGVIDYALSEVKSDWMDLFLCAQCRFFVGNTSGLFFLPVLFGVPVVLANMVPMEAAFGFYSHDRSIPKLVVGRTGDVLTFADTFDSGAAVMHTTQRFRELGFGVLSNSAEEICQLTAETMDVIDGCVVYTEDDERLQLAFRRLFLPGHFSYGSIARVGRDFLRRHSRLLADEPKNRTFGAAERIF